MLTPDTGLPQQDQQEKNGNNKEKSTQEIALDLWKKQQNLRTALLQATKKPNPSEINKLRDEIAELENQLAQNQRRKKTSRKESSFSALAGAANRKGIDAQNSQDSQPSNNKIVLIQGLLDTIKKLSEAPPIPKIDWKKRRKISADLQKRIESIQNELEQLDNSGRTLKTQNSLSPRTAEAEAVIATPLQPQEAQSETVANPQVLSPNTAGVGKMPRPHVSLILWNQILEELAKIDSLQHTVLDRAQAFEKKIWKFGNANRVQKETLEEHQADLAFRFDFYQGLHNQIGLDEDGRIPEESNLQEYIANRKKENTATYQKLENELSAGTAARHHFWDKIPFLTPKKTENTLSTKDRKKIREALNKCDRLNRFYKQEQLLLGLPENAQTGLDRDQVQTASIPKVQRTKPKRRKVVPRVQAQKLVTPTIDSASTPFQATAMDKKNNLKLEILNEIFEARKILDGIRSKSMTLARKLSDTVVKDLEIRIDFYTDLLKIVNKKSPRSIDLNGVLKERLEYAKGQRKFYDDALKQYPQVLSILNFLNDSDKKKNDRQHFEGYSRMAQFFQIELDRREKNPSSKHALELGKAMRDPLINRQIHRTILHPEPLPGYELESSLVNQDHVDRMLQISRQEFQKEKATSTSVSKRPQQTVKEAVAKRRAAQNSSRNRRAI